MTYEIISAKTCPYVQRVMILLEEKGVDYRHRAIDLKNKPEWFDEISPFGKVPLLKLLDGRALFESQVINEYLDEVDTPHLHPADPVEKAENRAWIELISSIIMSFGGYYYAPDEGVMEDRIKTVNDRLARLEGALGDGPFFNGEQFSLVDAAAAPLFSRMNLLNGYHELNLLQPFAKLTAWSNALLARPAVQAVATEVFQQDCIDALRKKDTYIGRYL